MTAPGERPDPTHPEVAHALAIAAEAHSDDVDAGGAPYMGHVRRVTRRVAEIAPPELVRRCQIVAALHDVVEDHAHEGWDPERLATLGFDEEILEALDSVTGRDGEAYEDSIHRSGRDPIGRWVKLADHLDNTDPARLARLPAEKQAHFARKYAGVRPILAEHGAIVPDE